MVQFADMEPVITDPKLIDDILTRGVEDIFVLDDLKQALLSGNRLRIKFGIDPTGPKLHIGRAAVLRKLRAFQKLGHQIVLIIGDFTAQIGDPSDKLAKRPMLTREVIEENMRDYKAQIGKIIDVDKVEFVYNSDWLRPLGFQEICQLAESFSVQQMLARRNFKDRVDNGEEISLREFMYPLMQGYDSVAVNADVEIGGFDQLFNLKAGRVIQRHYGKKEQNVLTVQMLEGTDGRKMSTSWGNIITIVDEPNDMYGKVMAVRDDLLIKYFILATDVSQDDIEKIKQDIANGVNPKEIKMRLARELVTMYHSPLLAKKAEEEFIAVFKNGAVPEDIATLAFDSAKDLPTQLIAIGIVESKSEWRRLVGENAVRIHNGEVITDANFVPQEETLLKIGKRRFVKITLS